MISNRHWATANGLQYTFLGLMSLGWWLCCGNFFFSIVVNSIPTLVPMMLNENGSSNKLIGFAVGSLPALLNVLINPIVSTASDRTRTRFGRRIPWLLASTPLVALSLVFTGWSPQLGAMVGEAFSGLTPQLGALMMVVLAGTMFQLFNLLFDPVFYCVANDVLPAEVRGRVIAAMGIAGTLGGYVLNKYLVPLSGNGIQWVFTGIAVCYLIGLYGLCFFVREGNYPPPEPLPKRDGPLARIELYFRECFSFPIYRWVFLAMALNVASTTCRTMYYLLFARQTLGLSLAQYGEVTGNCGLLTALLFFPAGIIIDKYHPVPVYFAGCLLIAASNAVAFFTVSDYPSFYVLSIAIAITYVLQNASNRPLLMAVFPAERFGQFCSANAMTFAITLIFANVGGGIFIDWFGYQYIFVWDFIFTLAGAFAALMMMREWRKHGGRNFTPPLK